jgi:hypothetical protein
MSAEQLQAIRKALASIDGIPYYAYGDNEAACRFADALREISQALPHENDNVQDLPVRDWVDNQDARGAMDEHLDAIATGEGR